MQYRQYNQPPSHPPVNYSHNSNSYHTPNSIQNWNVPELQQTPYELFAKPELPIQWANETMNNPAQATPESNTTAAGPGPAAYFQNGNGQLDFDKVISTVGQLASTYHQVSPIVKQFSSLIKTFR
ncbi:YppG family protein [Oceanobacillus massiliensis]|uniref:YppG family protein n=1 Tax=Oceanobacillus massiliensis TaxID=1465765 RepID=UPI00301784DF